MDYEGQICRAPMERSAYKLPIMVGCVYNRCKFCDLFKHLKFRLIPFDEVEADVRRVYKAGGSPRKLFLGDGSAFALPADYLMQVLDLIHRYFPECNEINMNATVKSVLDKTDSEMQMLYDNGVRHLYIGLESGLEDVLAFMDKGNTVAEARKAVTRMNETGFLFDAHIMTGAAGKGRGAENAAATASFLTEMNASSATNFSMFIHHETPLYQEMKAGRFEPASEYDNLVEDRELIVSICDALDKKGGTMKYEGFHDFIAFHVWGKLPADKDRMIAKLDSAIEEYRSKQEIKSIIEPGSTFEIQSVYTDEVRNK